MITIHHVFYLLMGSGMTQHNYLYTYMTSIAFEQHCVKQKKREKGMGRDGREGI